MTDAALDTPETRTRATSTAVLMVDARAVPRVPEVTWAGLIDDPLLRWMTGPFGVDEEGFEPPGKEVVRLACRIAHRYGAEGRTPPDRVVPDGDGGLAFELEYSGTSLSLNVYDDLTVELDVFARSSLSSRTDLTDEFRG